jgi:hypothetical protein
MAYVNEAAGVARETGLTSELTTLLSGLPTAAQADVGALTATAIAAAVPSAAPAGGTGATEGAYDTAVNRDAMIATVNGLVTHSTEVDLDYEALRADVAALRTGHNALLAVLRTAGIVTP